jgi:hypothetical protein
MCDTVDSNIKSIDLKDHSMILPCGGFRGEVTEDMVLFYLGVVVILGSAISPNTVVRGARGFWVL